MVECYLFFRERIKEFFEGRPDEPPIANTSPLSARLEECFQALRNALQVVAIDLEQGDDAQVIFETLNARGEPLLPADLLRNYIFLRAARLGESQEELYKKYWRPFDEPFWREIVSQGRINRPRSDLFMQHFLASSKQLIFQSSTFVEYRHWIEKEKPFSTVSAELAMLAEQRDVFRRLLEAEPNQPFTSFARFLIVFDIGTAYPLLLHIMAASPSAGTMKAIFEILESYLVRRAVCGLTNKNYNRVFLTLTRTLRRDGVTEEAVRRYLADLRGDSAEWPTDEAFYVAWEGKEIYQKSSAARIVYILSRLDRLYRGSKTEDIEVKSPLTIEHILPQGWLANWPLPTGERGLDNQELWNADPEDPKAMATRRRDSLLQTIGNLTILAQELNSSVSNASWQGKKPELLKHSLLPINQELHGSPVWDEEAILRRSRGLFEKALQLWPRRQMSVS